MALKDRKLAEMYAPVIRHEICRDAPHKDFAVCFDFDRPEGAPAAEFWNWRNPLKKIRIELLDPGNPLAGRILRTDRGCEVTDVSGAAHSLDLRAFVYYAVVRTRTHDFITYAWYHPSDWKAIGGHSNDMEGGMVVAETGGGRVVIVAALEHLDINAGRVDERGLPMTASREHENEVYLWYKNRKRPLMHVETKGHGVWLNARNRWFEDDWHGTVEYQPRPELPDVHRPPPFGDEAGGAYSDRDNRQKRAYELIPMYEPGNKFCLWEQFKDIRPDGSIGMNPPWLWTHRSDLGLADTGEWFLDPAFYYAYRRGSLGHRWGDLQLRDDVNSGKWALRYTENPYLEYKLSTKAKRAKSHFIPERGARMLGRLIDKKYQRQNRFFEKSE